MPVLFEPTGVEQLLLSTVCLVHEAIFTSGACYRCSFLDISSSCARECVFMTRDMLRIMAQENLMCPSRPTKKQIVWKKGAFSPTSFFTKLFFFSQDVEGFFWREGLFFFFLFLKECFGETYFIFLFSCYRIFRFSFFGKNTILKKKKNISVNILS